MQKGKLPNSTSEFSENLFVDPTISQKRCSICNLPVGAHQKKERGEYVMCNGERIKEK